MKKVLLLLLFAAFLTGCKPLLLKYYGIKDPKIENKETVYKYLQKKKIDTTDVVIFKDLPSLLKASEAKMLAIPDAMFYNTKGEFVSYKKTAKDCNAKVFDFITDLKTLNDQPADATKGLTNLKPMVSDFNGVALTPKRGYDGYVIITWAIHAGKLNKEKAFEWVKLIKQANNNGANIKYYLLNTDIQERWNLTDKEKKSLFED